MGEQAIADLDVETFWERGYAVLPGVYSPDEVAELRQAAYDSKGQGGDLLANPRLRHVLLDGRMIEVARKLLGTDDIIYMGDSSFTINGTQRGFHKDNTDRLDPKAPDWESPYTQLRFGIYCQDHSEHTGGLNLRIGSHDIPDTTSGENLYVKTTPGDLAVWSMRISHSGNGMLLKDPSAPFPLPDEQDSIPAEEVAPPDGDRIAIFAHLGANDSHATRYGDYLKTRKYMVDAWRKRPYDAEALDEASKVGLTVRNLPAEVMNDPSAGHDETWQPFPYAKKVVPAAAGPTQAAAPTAHAQGVQATARRYARAAARRTRGTLRGAYRGFKESGPKKS
jgi:hypothetical protein